MGVRKCNLKCFAVLFCFGCVWACAGNQKNVGPMQPAEQPLITKRAATPVSEEAPYTLEANLFNENTYTSLFRDLRAYRVGDLVTINIVETSKASKEANTNTERTSGIEAGINNFLGYEAKLSKIFPDDFDNTKMFNANMTNEFEGKGTTSRNETMTASMTARVLKVLPNGNLFIEGRRQIKVNNEVQYIVLSGLVRPVDISSDNTVLSSFIAEAKIDYTGSGPVSDKQRPGWMMRILDAAWPF